MGDLGFCADPHSIVAVPSQCSVKVAVGGLLRIVPTISSIRIFHSIIDTYCAAALKSPITVKNEPRSTRPRCLDESTAIRSQAIPRV